MYRHDDGPTEPARHGGGAAGRPARPESESVAGEPGAEGAVGVSLVVATRGLAPRVREAAGRWNSRVIADPLEAPAGSILLLDERAIPGVLAGGEPRGLAGLLDHRPDLVVVVLGADADPRSGRRWLDEGAADWLPQEDIHLVHLPLVLARAQRRRAMRRENERLHHDLARSLVELELKNQELETLVNRLEQAARTDPVTRLANRWWLDAMLEGNWDEAKSDGLPLALVMVDLDGFKRLNDALGHQRGDEVLRIVARVLEGNCRASDVVARYGGDEFCLLLPETHPDEAIAVVRRILGVFLEVIEDAIDGDVAVGISLGIAHMDLSVPQSAAELLAHADEAMYAAKARGPNRYAVRLATAVEVHAGPDGSGADELRRRTA